VVLNAETNSNLSIRNAKAKTVNSGFAVMVTLAVALEQKARRFDPVPTRRCAPQEWRKGFFSAANDTLINDFS
jgi:hypothetical protein